MQDVCVVGGGIAGLYASMKLLDKGYRVCLLEASERFGGRIYTVHHDDGSMYESGAARFNFSHKRFMRLLKKLGISSYMMNSQGKTYIRKGVQRQADTDRVLKQVFEKAHEYKPAYLKARTLETFLREILPDHVVEDLIFSFGYRSEFDTCNAWDALQVFQHDFQESVSYFSLSEGMSILVNKLLAILQNHPNMMMLPSSKVTSYQYTKGKCQLLVDGRTKPIHAHRVIFCITKKGLQSIEGLQENKQLLSSLKTTIARPLHRIYARFPVNKKKQPWFYGMKRITTDNMLGYIIPIQPVEGLIMISYTDGEQARTWNNLAKVGVLQEEIMKQVRKLFPHKRIPDPMWTDSQYWEEGAHYWGLKPKKYKNTMTSINKYGYAVAGEVVSHDHQAWIEGALQSVDTSLRYFA